MQASGSSKQGGGQIVLNITPGRYDITLVPLAFPLMQANHGPDQHVLLRDCGRFGLTGS